MKLFPDAVRLRRGLLSAVVAAAVLSLSACTGAGRFGDTAICEAAGGRYVGDTCALRLSPAELVAQQACETHGGVYLEGEDRCAFGMGVK